MSNSTSVKNGLIPAVVQVKCACLLSVLAFNKVDVIYFMIDLIN